MKRLWIAMAAVVAVGGSWASEAASAIYRATYTGHVLKGFDHLHIFGDEFRFDGEKFVAVYLFDTDLGAVTHLTPTWEERVGGSNIGAASPFLDAAITIKGVTYHMDGGWESNLSYRQGFHVSHGVSPELTPAGNSYLVNFLRYAPFSRVTDTGFYAGDDGSGGLAIYDGDIATTASLDADTVLLAAAPEPATWALMITGMAGVGAALRSRRRTAHVSG